MVKTIPPRTKPKKNAQLDIATIPPRRKPKKITQLDIAKSVRNYIKKVEVMIPNKKQRLQVFQDKLDSKKQQRYAHALMEVASLDEDGIPNYEYALCGGFASHTGILVDAVKELQLHFSYENFKIGDRVFHTKLKRFGEVHHIDAEHSKIKVRHVPCKKTVSNRPCNYSHYPEEVVRYTPDWNDTSKGTLAQYPARLLKLQEETVTETFPPVCQTSLLDQ